MHLTKVTFLDLSFNSIAKLEEEAFDGMNELKYLALGGDKLTML